MTPTRTVVRFSRLLVLVPVTVCATISYLNEQQSPPLPRCRDRTPPPQTLAKCRYDVDCMQNAYCWNQEACLCKDDYIVYRNRTHVECLKVANTIGDPCEADVQCRVTFAPYSECRQNICQCTDSSHYVEGRCYESVGLGLPCLTHRNCYIRDSYCVTGFCACTLRYHPNPRNDGCIPSAELGDKCSNDYECVVENSKCVEVCSCKVDYVLSKDGKRCLKAANSVGEPCQEDSQCQLFLKDTICGFNGKCSCVENFHQRGSVCFRDTMLGARCEIHRECNTLTYRHSNITEVMSVDCIGGFCICANDYTATEDMRDCIRYSDNGAVATTSERQMSLVLFFIFFANVSIL
ncbi:PREDICTED: prion-like-(Q/N-rich) domain-bearing protein 25 isoform X1 [Habropoda laboriosa]|uniref:prion-like-(Q/N-rich) domain-bearing protein 25 isoform X1 n=1 Tax=Habropoda laboriosa TaxID=597456 RepID=UPI00083E6B88|nr:PREDICTED: prion-like-(Q/N-rich) domain-bearing protein 25 isoform X1 [Habropoda laboriosa]XP_017793634.1 PREDICTED: prion-like-(Q/N-rich) domain-bearing protein 25 isoform X1 [Habropoda laboriosa]